MILRRLVPVWLVALWLVSQVSAAPVEFAVLFDSDDNPFTGCFASGMSGVDHVFTTTVETAAPARVTAVLGQRCANGSLGARQVLDAAGWPATWNAETGELSIETRLPVSFFDPRPGARMRVAISLSSGLGAAHLSTQHDGGPIILIGTASRRRAVATPSRPITPDGQESDWAGFPPLAFGGPGTAALRIIDVTASHNAHYIFFRFRGQANVNAPTAADDSYSTAPGTPLVVAAPGVLGNDTDPRGLPLSGAVVDDVNHGTLVFNADGSFSYTDGGGAQRDHFTYRASNGEQQSNIARVDIGVGDRPNRPPVTGDDAYEVPRGGTLSVIPPGVLGNDNDPDLDPLQAVLQAGPAEGTVSLNPNGSFNYVHGGATTGPDQFTYHATDGTEMSRQTTVHIHVRNNEAPIATDDSYSVNEGAALTVAAPGLLANDSDPDSSALTASVATNPLHGTVTVNGDGSFTYLHDGSETTSDEFTYQISDGAATATATVRLTVLPVNDAPFAAADSYTVAEDGTLNIAAPGVLANDTDADSSVTTAILASSTTNGTLSLSANGAFTYSPNGNFSGTDTFTYRAGDGTDSSANAATVTITVTAVNDPPSFTSGPNVTVAEDSPAYSAAWATAITAGPNESTQSVVFNTTNDQNALFTIQPALSADGTLTFTPAANASGTATVTVTLSDNGTPPLSTAPVTFTVTVTAVNDAPSFMAGGNVSVLEDSGPYSAGWATAVSAGPADEAAQTVTFTATNDNSALFSIQPAISPAGLLTFTPASNAFGTATVTVSLKDNGGTANGGVDTTAPQTFVITVTGVNDEPGFAAGPNVTVLEDSGAYSAPWATAVTAGTNEAAQALTFTVSNDNNSLFNVQPAISAAGVLTFTPSPNGNGSATVTLSLSDNGGTANGGDDTSPAVMFTITVTAVNDAPTFTSGGDVVVNENSGAYSAPWATSISAGAADEAGQVLTFGATNSNNALFSVQPAVAADGTLSYTVTANANGTATVTVTLSDNGGTANGGVDQSVQTFIITVSSVNSQPSFTAGGNVVVLEDSGAYSAGWATAIDPGAGEGSQSVTFVVSNDANALFAVQPAVSPTGVLTFVPAANAHGSATVSVYLMDDGGTANGGDDTSPTVTFTLAVTPVNDEPFFTSGGTVSVAENSGPYSAAWATGMTAGPADEGGQVLTFAPTTNDNNALFSAQPSIAADGTLTFIPAADTGGTATVTVTLTDNGGTANGGDDTFVVTFTIDVPQTNSEPTFTAGPDINILEDSGAFTSPWATAISAGSGEGGQTLTFVVSNDNNALFAAQPQVASDGTLTFTPTSNLGGMATVSVYLMDDGGTANGGDDTSPTVDFTITITGTNDAPSFTSGGNVNVLEDSSAYSATWATAISAGPTDEAGQTLTFNVSNDNNGLFSAQPAIATDGTLTFTAVANAFGSATVTVTLSDDGGTANGGIDTSSTQMFTITVDAVNDTPTFTAGADVTVDEDSAAYNAAWATAISPGPASEAAQTVTFVVANNNNSLFSVQPAISPSGTLTFTLAANQFGTATVTVYLQDNGGTANGGDDASDSVNLTITVNAVNDAPTALNKTHATHSAIGLTINAASHTGELKEGATDVEDPFAELTVQLTGAVVPSEATVTLLDAGNGSFYFEPPGGFTGSATFQFRVCDDNVGDPNQCSSAATVTVNVTGQQTWFIDDAPACGGACNGSLTKPLPGLNNADGDFAARGTGDSIFVFSGSYNHGYIMAAGERVIGQGSSAIQVALNHNYAPYTNGVLDPLPGSAAAPTLQNTVTAASNTVLRGVAIVSIGKGYVGNSSALTVLESSVSGANTAVELANATGSSITFSSTSSTGGTHGITLTDVSGTFAFGTGALINNTTAAFALSNSAANAPVVTYGGNINPANTGRPVDIGTALAASGMRGGSVTLSGNIGDVTPAATGIRVRNSTAGVLTLSGTTKRLTTTTNNAVDLAANPGAIVTISNGGLAITTTTGKGLTAVGGGTVAVTTGAQPNTISSAGGIALEVQTTDIGASGLTFRSISATGGANGILLVSTGLSGGLTVTGDGVDSALGGNASGGTISGATGADGAVSGSAIYLSNTSNVVLRRMAINGTNQNFGIRGFRVNNFILEYATVNGTIGTHPTFDNYGEGSVMFGDDASVTTNGLTGSATVTSCIFGGGRARNFSVVNTAGTLNRLTISNSTFNHNQAFADANQSLAVEARNAGTVVNVTATNNTFTGSPGDLANFTGQTGTTMDAVFQTNTMTNNHAHNIIGGGGLTFATQGVMTLNVSNNIQSGANGSAITLQKASAGTSMTGTLNGNQIGTVTAGSGSATGNGIFFSFAGGGLINLAVTNNQIRSYDGNAGIYADNTGGTYDVVLNIAGNVLASPGPGAFAGLALTAGAPGTADDIDVCATITGNDFSVGDPTNANDIILGVSAGASSMKLPGYAGATLTDVQTFVRNNNLNAGATAVTAYVDPPATAANFIGGASCP